MRELELIKSALEGLAVSVDVNNVDGTINVRIEPGKLREVVMRLKSLGFDHPISISAVDYIDRGVLTLIYTFRSYLREDLKHVVVHVRTDVPRDSPRIASISDVFPSADYDEREAHEMFGVWFEGNPNMGRRFLLDPEFEHPAPLRKDFKLPEPTVTG